MTETARRAQKRDTDSISGVLDPSVSWRTIKQIMEFRFQGCESDGQAASFDARIAVVSLNSRACPAHRTHRGQQLNDQELFYSIAALNALFSSMAWCVAKPNRWSILAVLTFALIWPFANGNLEGDVLLTVNSTMGITVSDLLSVLAVLIALIQAIRIRRAARRNQSATEHSDITEKL
jgi:hypothetical protein